MKQAEDRIARAIVFPEINAVELRTTSLPAQGKWDITVELETSAISVGTERWALLGKRPPGDVTFPCIPGYLSVGRITATGSQVKGYAVGDRVNFLAANTPDGYEGNWMCGHVSPAVVNVNPSKVDPLAGLPYCQIVPDGLSAEHASLAALGAVACRGIELARPTIGDTVLVVGQGVIGQFVAQICRLKGACVITADIIESRVAISRRYAADRAIDSRKEDLADAVKAITPDGADVLIDTSSSVELINQLVAEGVLKAGGRLVFQGWYPPPSALNLHNLQNRLTRGVYFPSGHSGTAVGQVMRWMLQGLLKVEPMISHRFAISQAAEAYQLLVHEPDQILGVVFDWSEI